MSSLPPPVSHTSQQCDTDSEGSQVCCAGTGGGAGQAPLPTRSLTYLVTLFSPDHTGPLTNVPSRQLLCYSCSRCWAAHGTQLHAVQ